jgi:glutamyl-tRNA synthetase
MPLDANQKVFFPGTGEKLQLLANRFATVEPFTPPIAEETLKLVSGELGIKPSALVQPCRVAVTGSYVGPSLYETLAIVGREKVVERLNNVASQIPPSGIAPNLDPKV